MNDSPGRNSPGPHPPGPPGPPPPPGWQNGPGWGNRHWAPLPHAPQPGVVPLRPLGLGEILQGSFATLSRYWRTVLPVSFGIALVTQAATTVANGLWLKDGQALDDLRDDATSQQVLDTMKDSLGALGITMIAGLVGSILASSILTVVVSRAVLGRPVSTAEAWRAARPQLARMAGLLCLIPLMLLGVFALGAVPGLLLLAAGADSAGIALALLGSLAGLVAMVWLWVRYSLAAPALMLEKQRVTESLRRSAKLVRGVWWRILGVQVVALLVISAITMVVQIPVSAIQLITIGDLDSGTSVTWPSLIISGVGAVISSTVALPFMAGVTALIYLDQRIRRESLDVELIRATTSD
ncbi:MULTISPECIES: glycerophosphoryl diester phosphodiesterase membrane domain-containing protein [Streptomyces]|uniref:glycerophosphoryl diester phosphodiesterase membrane domain-containing protein n=1 Tax=Streptomyces TaxID=1883 RepID=UPI001C8D9128|nr:MULTISPECIES: glycerophosphoryl diester phosphodiesterase membrane domain-containing protein [Streptomyces]UBI38567.1 glycerophosphoryl diester phosphodiesterase membrane domain-containing protein [Streptomyces mobaraensis]UKW31150.1 glycerophosphoryl diester phosphodiesterase membrane domain-containing protein [Streptomyces sp. TYQ1024]